VKHPSKSLERRNSGRYTVVGRKAGGTVAGKEVRFLGAFRILFVLVVIAGGGRATIAQLELRPGNLPDAPVPKQSQNNSSQGAKNSPLKTTLETLGRRSVFFPELAHEKGPLSSRQKLELAVDESIAPSRLLGSAFTAGIGQARDGLPGYGQEWGGYGKRFGSSIASSASNHLFGTFLLPSMFHQDPRYFVKLHGSPAQRISYAFRRVVVTRTDSGDESFNWSGVVGSLMAEGLANSYLPDRERTAGNTFSRFGIRMGFSVVSNVVKEYWPTIFKSLRVTKLVPSEQSDPGTVTPPPTNGPPPKP